MSRERTPSGSYRVVTKSIERIDGDAPSEEFTEIEQTSGIRQSQQSPRIVKAQIAELWAEVPQWLRYLVVMFLSGSGGSMVGWLPFVTKEEFHAAVAKLEAKIDEMPATYWQEHERREREKAEREDRPEKKRRR